MPAALAAANQWLDLGISTIPIRAHSKKPALSRWRPYQDRLPRQDELRAWWGRAGYGLAVLTGQRGLSVIDFDDTWAYSCWLAGLSPALAKVALTTYRVRTRRGTHTYFFCDESAETRSFKSDGLGFDTRGPGGYVLAPPTIHPSGVPYIGIGRPADTRQIDSVYEFIPTAHQVIQAEREVSTRKEDTDLWDLAMRDSPGISVSEIKQAFTFESLLSEPYSGRRRVWAVHCPLHNDGSPSFAVYPDGHAHCFGCGFHGDIIDFYAALHKLSIQEAIAELGRRLVSG